MRVAAFGALCLVGLAMQALFVRALFLGSVGAGLACLHLTSALACGWGLAGLSPRRERRVPLAAFFAAVSLFLPFLGPLGAGLAVVGSAWWPVRRPCAQSLRPITAPDLPERSASAPTPPRLGAASAYGRLRHSPALGDRLGAVVALRDVGDRAAVPVLRLALKDRADEVRLLAFTLLQDRERAFYADIHARQKDLETASGEQAVAHHLRIAQAYWELAYQDLVQGELLAYALDEAGTHLSQAIAAQPSDPDNTLLLGRIRLRQGRLDEATRLFDQAATLGVPASVVRPHQAEAAFLARDFAKTRASLAALPREARKLAVIGELLEFWS